MIDLKKYKVHFIILLLTFMLTHFINFFVKMQTNLLFIILIPIIIMIFNFCATSMFRKNDVPIKNLKGKFNPKNFKMRDCMFGIKCSMFVILLVIIFIMLYGTHLHIQKYNISSPQGMYVMSNILLVFFILMIMIFYYKYYTKNYKLIE